MGAGGTALLSGCQGAGGPRAYRRDTSGNDRSTSSRPSTPVFEQFVTRDGTTFTVDGEPFHFSGANNYFLQESYRSAAGTIDEILPDARALGLDVLRTWAFGSGEPDKYQPRPREYNEAEFQRLDEVIWAAGQHGIRLVLPLVNGYPNLGGMDQYVEWSPTAETHNDFYTDDHCRSIYKDYVEYVLTRENTITGLEYREDPTIMIWELANEPHLRDHEDPTRRWTDAEYRIMQAWIDEMGRFVKRLDGNHLVSTGSEGNYGDETFGHPGGPGEYVGDHRSDAIDAASFHLYHRYDADPSAWVKTHVRDAHESLGKPAYLGEFGTIFLDRRVTFYREVYDALRASQGNGAAFWQLIGHDGETGKLRTPEPDAPVDSSGYYVYYPESEETVRVIRSFSETADSITGSSTAKSTTQSS